MRLGHSTIGSFSIPVQSTVAVDVIAISVERHTGAL